MSHKLNAEIISEHIESPLPESRLKGKWLRIARVGWIFLTLVALVLLVTSLPGYLGRGGSGLPDHGPGVEAGRGFDFLQTLNLIASLASFGLSVSLSFLLFQRRFDNLAGAVVSFYLLVYGIVLTGPLEVWERYWLGSSDLAINMQALLLATPTIALLALFPTGTFVPYWIRWILVASIPWNVLAMFFPITGNNISGLLILGFLWVALLGFGLYAQIYRYRRVSTQDERQQARWVLLGFGLWFGYVLITSYPYFYLESLPIGNPRPWWAPLLQLGWWFSLSIIPATLAIAITRSRLWNIDVVVNRTMVYGALTLVTLFIYVFVVGALGNFLNSGDNTFVAILATGLVAVLFQPLRDRMQRAVNRFMYGERDDPYTVLARLGQRLEATASSRTILPTIVETIAQALKLPYVAIVFTDHRGSHLVAAYGTLPPYQEIRYPLVYQNESFGELVLVQRSETESFTSNERQLLADLAREVGVAAHNVRLTADLQRSREQLVMSREEERRRIRRDLHDGLGPVLASLNLKLDAARNHLRGDPDEADSILLEIKSQTQDALSDIRRLVYNLRPPALDELGFLSAIKEYANSHYGTGLSVKIEHEDDFPNLPAAVEVAAYRIIFEALNNVSKHANATKCMVRLAGNGELQIDITDNGIGIPKGFHSGVGTRSMLERAAELGGECTIQPDLAGGTRVNARLPYKVIDDES
ncbi:MAG TPA: GAF domain-containing sensor histidine kinase [Anaerolineales bacterium]|nr:GAF domain-containing sensor histidine kinase [Anaerolineales bacterium]